MKLAYLLCAALLVPLLAGCTGSSDPTGPGPDQPLPPDKGAMNGLLIDDRYRPIEGGLVLLTPGALTATSDALGQFSFTDLKPGVYLLRTQVDGHEAAPKNVDVTAGQYSEPEVVARRIFSESGGILTNEFSAFIPCAVNDVENSYNVNCVGDLSGDSFRGGFRTEKINKTMPWTVMVSEVLVNQQGNFAFQVREDNGESGGGERYAVGAIEAGDYKKLVNVRGVQNVIDNVQANNVPFNGTKPFDTVIFPTGSYEGEVQDGFDGLCAAGATPVCRDWSGVGATFGLKAKMVQSIFIGVPEKPVETYCVLDPAGCGA